MSDDSVKSFEILDKKSGSDHFSNISPIIYDRTQRADLKKTSEEIQRNEEPFVRPKPLPRITRIGNRRMNSVSEHKTNPKTFEMHSNYETIGETEDKEKDSPLIVVKMNENFDFLGREVNFKSLDPKIKQMVNSLDKNYCYFIQNIKK